MSSWYDGVDEADGVIHRPQSAVEVRDNLLAMIFYTDSSFPLWAKLLVCAAAVTALVVFAWRYYVHYWRK